MRISDISYSELVEVAKANFRALAGRDIYFAWLSKGSVIDHVIDDIDLKRAMLEQKRPKRTIYRFEIVSFEPRPKNSEEEQQSL